MPYIYERLGWPTFRLDQERLARRLAAVRHLQGRLLGRMQGLDFDLRAEATVGNITDEVLESNEIEGERLDRNQVRSSIARKLGVDIGALTPADRMAEGAVEMMMDATQHYAEALTEERIFAWHAAIFPNGRGGSRNIAIGAWRRDSSGPMQVVSGAVGHEPVHFEAPPAARIADEMRMFLEWFGRSDDLDHVLKAGVAHLWFVTIHPFDDGNGRIARAIADLQLARSEESSQRFYSMSAQIRAERSEYYHVLETTQKGDLDITAWMLWFLHCLDRALEGAEDRLSTTLRKATFWNARRAVNLNDRQRLMINRMLDGFEGKLTTSKWAKMTKSSSDTALRDIDALIALGILEKDSAGGRSTNYSLVDRTKEGAPFPARLLL